IVNPAIQANNFELKPSLLQIVQQNQFFGNPTEDPNLHLSVFVQFADTLKSNGVDPEAIRLRLFPFSLRDRARAWLQSLPSNSITTWNELKKAFLARYFPPSKTAQLRNQITCFRQTNGESLFEAWERYKDIMRACPHHRLEKWLIIHTFYNGLLYNTRMTIDAAVGGALMDKPFAEAYQLIENMAQNHYQWGSERTPVEKSQPKGGMYVVSSLDHMNAKVEALTQKLDNLTVNPAATIVVVTPNCEICGISGHVAANCQLLATPTTQPGFHNQKGAHVAPVAPQKSNLELMMENFVSAQTQQNKEFINQNIHTNELIKQLRNRVRARDLGKSAEKDSKRITDKDTEREPIAVDDGQTLKANKVIENDLEKPYVPPPPYKPPIPYPQRLAKSKNPGQFEKFIEMLKKLHIDIPFIEAITQIPSYAKFLKDILSNKRKLEDTGPVECNAINENKLAPKLEDPGNFSIP
ncbi:hypothetical protein A2U01_0008188, partial [Trifolium medium]|nr:hypothetical protein [Trifolium medium]